MGHRPGSLAGVHPPMDVQPTGQDGTIQQWISNVAINLKRIKTIITAPVEADTANLELGNCCCVEKSFTGLPRNFLMVHS